MRRFSEDSEVRLSDGSILPVPEAGDYLASVEADQEDEYAAAPTQFDGHSQHEVVIENVPSSSARSVPPISSAPGRQIASLRYDLDVPVERVRFLIDGVFRAESIGILGGQSSSGKTYVLLEMARCLATGSAFFGREINERVGTLIVAGEGGATLANRIAAMKLHNGLAPDDPLPIAILEDLAPLNTVAGQDAIERFIPSVKEHFKMKFGMPLGMIFFDTLAATFDLDDENSNATASRAVRLMMQISRQHGAAVCAVHHLGKNSSAGLRGASAWRGGVDQTLIVTTDQDDLKGTVKSRQLHVAKVRDGVTGTLAPFELTHVRLGADEHGDWGDVAVHPLLGQEPAAGRHRNRAEVLLDQLFGSSASSVGHPFVEEQREVLAIRCDTLRGSFVEAYVVGGKEAANAESARKAYRRLLDRLPDQYEIRRQSETDWLVHYQNVGDETRSAM
tara:strand:- start:335 stop:1678 length:1344 start_codon:yes stop_codon:yes gene_type:complete